ncbi:MAG: RNA methyltransferase [Betaproteobacteria bacterium]|nr:RNA methyltransferase [Betaproteobacteria bacterium]
MHTLITSRDNPVVRQLAGLQDAAKARRRSDLTLLEGWTLIQTCLDAPAFGPRCVEYLAISETLAASPEGRGVRARAEAASLPLHVIASSTYGRIGPSEGPNAVLATLRLGMAREAWRWTRPATARFELWLDSVQDPGNVGTLIRTAAASGAARVVLGPGCADPWAPKTLRAGMGGQFATEILEAPDLLDHLGSVPFPVFATLADGATPVFDTDLAETCAVLLGNEGAGVNPALVKRAAGTIRIPMVGVVESLNVAAAGAVVCFERVRQMGARARAASGADGS